MIFLKYLSGVANLLQKYLLKCYFWNIWAVWPIYCRNICCDNIFEIFELCDQNPAGHERSVQLKQKIEIKSRYKKNMMQETISLPRAWTGRSTQMEGTQTELSTTSTQGCSGFLAHFPSYFVWKCICIMMHFHYLPNSTEISTNGEKAMLSWLDIHMVLIPINPRGALTLSPDICTFLCDIQKCTLQYCILKIVQKLHPFLRDQSPSPIFTRDTFRWEWYIKYLEQC